MLVRFLLYLLCKLGYTDLVIPLSVVEISESMQSAVKDIDRAPQSGEWKKHQVYALGLKWFPHVPRRDVSLAIEYAVRRVT